MRNLPLLYTFIVLCLQIISATTSTGNPAKYPFYNNCNPSWGSKTMGSTTKTICEAGSMLSCIASGLYAMNIKIKGV